MRRKRLGFTLVELLIVIIVIGILVGGMLILKTSTSDSAKATVLISNLRAARMAGNIWISENIDSNDIDIVNAWVGADMSRNLAGYMDREELNLVFIYLPSVGYLVGEPDVPASVISRALGQTGGYGRLLDEKGDPLVYSGHSATACFLVRN